MKDMTISRLTACIYRTGQAILNKQLEEDDLTSVQLECLYAIIIHEGQSQLELSKALFTGKSAITKTVRVLVEKGYIYREVDVSDKRLYHLYLTPKGRELAPKVRQTFSDFVALHLENLLPEEQEQIMLLMEKVFVKLLETKEQLGLTQTEGV